MAARSTDGSGSRAGRQPAALKFKENRSRAGRQPAALKFKEIRSRAGWQPGALMGAGAVRAGRIGAARFWQENRDFQRTEAVQAGSLKQSAAFVKLRDCRHAGCTNLQLQEAIRCHEAAPAKSQSDRREWSLRTGDGFPPVVHEAVSTRAVTSVAKTIRANPKSVEIPLGDLLAVLEIAPACLEVPAMECDEKPVEAWMSLDLPVSTDGSGRRAGRQPTNRTARVARKGQLRPLRSSSDIVGVACRR